MTALFYDLTYGMPLCVIAILFAGTMLGAPQQPAWSLAVGLLSLGICAGIKYWESRLRFLLPGLFLAVYAGIVIVQGRESRWEFILQNRWILWIALLSAGCFFVGRFAAEMKWVRRALAIAFLLDLTSALFLHLFPNKAVTALELFFLLVCMAEEVQMTWVKSGYTDRKGHLVSILPFLVVILVSVYLLPAPNEPFSWDFAVQIWKHAVEEIKITNRFLHQKDEDYANMGFPESGDFWGNLRKQDKKVMEVSGRADTGEVVYLTGRVMDHFDGRSWSADYAFEGWDRMIDTLESLSAVTMQEPEFLQNYLWRVDVKCKYDEFNTKYFFVPLKSLLDVQKIGDIPYLRRGADLVAGEKLGYGTEYVVSYFRLNQGHEEIRDFLENLPEIDQSVWEGVRRQYDTGAADTGYEDYLLYQERMKEYYCQEVSLSERLSAYVDELLAGADSDFEKLERLEKMLSSQEYSASPGKLPEWVDSPEEYLDYFLLELQKGYCSHYATAFVLLARSQGIPARYAEGYYVKKGKNGSVTVMTDMAHAWPEVYLKGYGWIAFEPTPGYKRTVRWDFRKTATSVGDFQPMEEHEEEREEVELPTAEEVEKPSVQWQVIVLPLGFGGFFVIGFVLVDLVLSKRWYANLEPEKKYYVTFWRNIRILSMLGFAKNQGETLEEFRLRVTRETTEEEGGAVEVLLRKEKQAYDFLEDYEGVIYGGLTPDAEMNQRVEKCHKLLMEQLREKKGKWFWWYYFLINSKKRQGGNGKHT